MTLFFYVFICSARAFSCTTRLEKWFYHCVQPSNRPTVDHSFHQKQKQHGGGCLNHLVVCVRRCAGVLFQHYIAWMGRFARTRVFVRAWDPPIHPQTCPHLPTHPPTQSPVHSLTPSLHHSITHLLTHCLTHSLTHLLTDLPTHPLNHSPLTHSLPHSPAHSPTHSPTNPRPI